MNVFTSRLFLIFAWSGLVFSGLDFSHRLFVDFGNDNFVPVFGEILSLPGEELRGSFYGSEIYLEERSNLRFTELGERIGMSSSRGAFEVLPDRDVRFCSRAVCLTTSSEFGARYYTPGEVIVFSVGGNGVVEYNEKSVAVYGGDVIRIDELTGDILLFDYTSSQVPWSGRVTDSMP